MITFTLDNQPVSVEEHVSVLAAARAHGVNIPTLCYHPAVKASGSCRICAVEIIGRSGLPTTMLSCILMAREGLVVNTGSDLVREARRKAFKRLLEMAPQSKKIRDTAESCGIFLGAPPDGCIRCRLCIRVCKEVVGADALVMEKRNGVNFVTPIEGRCIGCGTCANICPTDAITLVDRENVRVIGIRDEIIGRHPLAVCEGCGKSFATPKFLAYIEQRTGPHPHIKEEHRYCPTCAKLFSDRIRSFARPARR